ncbi:MAG: gamma carbonic anhydrase family protein [Beijerinckiaceae bacterium]|jgi:carbonic anhydrase/acetyltransferase-like protein (isoleucine patch superfamily)
MTPSLILPFHQTAPRFAGPVAHAGPRSAVLGRATIGANVSLGEDSVIRADGQEVHLGANVWLGRRATVHIVHDILPAIVGDNVTAGTNAIIHACTVGDNCVIEADVTILDAAVVEANVLIEAGSTVFPRKVLESGMVYAGSPAKPVRPLREGELAERAAALRASRESEPALAPGREDFGETVFIARTSQRAGRLSFAPGSSLFFSCVADAGSGIISIGENTNIQDNTVMRAGSGEVVIGRDTTVGHNVRMGAARVGANALVGIGAILAEGTVIEDHVLLAAGATTEPGQVLDAGWMWAGRPARALSKLDDAKHAMMAQNILTYCDYSRTFRRLQQENLQQENKG